MPDLYTETLMNLSREERIKFLAVLLRVARVDEVSPLELEWLQPAAKAVKASPEEQIVAVQKANDQDLSLAQLTQSFSALPIRYLLFHECCAVAWVDGYCTEGEQNIISAIAHQLEIHGDPRLVMDSPVACSPEGKRRFLELLEKVSSG